MIREAQKHIKEKAYEIATLSKKLRDEIRSNKLYSDNFVIGIEMGHLIDKVNGNAEQDKAGVYNILIMEERQTIIACGAGSTTKLVLPEKIKTSSGKETNLIRVENVKNITEYIDRIDEMIERKEALFEKD